MRRENRFHLGKWVASAALCAGCTQRIPEQQLTPTPSLSQSVPPHAALVFSESKTPIERPDSSSDKLQWTSEGTIFMCHFSCDLAPLSAHGGVVLSPHYTPPNLVSINHLRNPALPHTTQLRATRETANALAMLTQELHQKGLSITVNSAHRGYSEQIAVYSAQPSTSASKAGSDHLVRAYYDTYGLPITITNCANNYGPYHYPEKLIPLAITNILEGKKVPIYGDGLYVRDWLHVEDHCRAIDAVICKGKIGETYCVGGMTQDISNKEIIKIICERMGVDFDKTVEYVKDRPGHDRRYAIDWSKIKGELGWEPLHSFDDWITLTIQWYKDHESWWKRIKSGEYEKYYKEQYGK
jgi:dTDP-D-glucose 4,6-dehydratase